MVRRRNKRRGIALPWERQDGWWRRLLSRSRWKAVFWMVLVAASIIAVWTAAAHRSRIRATRITILETRRALTQFRDDHGRCPRDLEELVHPPHADRQYLSEIPVDAWGKRLYLRCPSRFDADDVDVVSAGPSGSFFQDDNLQ